MVEFELAKIKKVFPSEDDFRKFLREVLIRKLPKEEWSAKRVVDYIVACRQSGGIPMFRTGFAGEDYYVGGKPAVMAVCWAGTDPQSRMFVGVPEPMFRNLKERHGDWHFLMIKYAPEKYREAKKYPVRLV